MVENLTDNEILQRLKHCDEKVTKEFFYDTCHIAYCIDNKKYGLQYKTGMDFFSLAHEYYLRLLKNDWRQLEKRKSNITLANWMMNGFHYLVRERLHTYSKGEFEESIEERTSKGQLGFDFIPKNSTPSVSCWRVRDLRGMPGGNMPLPLRGPDAHPIRARRTRRHDSGRMASHIPYIA